MLGMLWQGKRVSFESPDEVKHDQKRLYFELAFDTKVPSPELPSPEPPLHFNEFNEFDSLLVGTEALEEHTPSEAKGVYAVSLI